MKRILSIIIIMCCTLAITHAQELDVKKKLGTTMESGSAPGKVAESYIGNEDGTGVTITAYNVGEDTMRLVTIGDTAYWVSSKDMALRPKQGTGNVGINTTTPTATLDVNGDVNVGLGITAGEVSTGSIDAFSMSFQGLIPNALDTAGILAAVYGGSVSRCNFKCADLYDLVSTVNNYIDSLIWTRNGTSQIIQRDTSVFVGVGITEPLAQLHIHSDVATTGSTERLLYVTDKDDNGFLNIWRVADGRTLTLIGNSDQANSGFLFQSLPGNYTLASGTFNNFSLTSDGSSGDVSNFDFSDDVIVLQPSNGNVGIGTDAPTAKLQVNGGLRLVNGSESNGYILTSDVNGLATWRPNNIVTFTETSVDSFQITPNLQVVTVDLTLSSLSVLMPNPATCAGAKITVRMKGDDGGANICSVKSTAGFTLQDPDDWTFQSGYALQLAAYRSLTWFSDGINWNVLSDASRVP